MRKYISSTLIACILCFIIGFGTACSCSDVEIKEIYFNNTTINLVVGDIIDCDAEKLGLSVLPKNATNQEVNFVITKEDRTLNGVKVKVLDDSQKPKIVAVNPGIATITARTLDGASIATLTVRVFPNNYTLSAPNGLTFDNINQRVLWDEKSYLIDDRYPDDDAHRLSEVFYQVELNGEVVEVTKNNYFDNFAASQNNNVRVRTITLPNSDFIKSSNFTSAVNFQVLPAPTNLQLTQTGLVWDAVDGANSYSVIVYKKLNAITLEKFEEFKNITETTYALDIDEAGDFVVEVKAVPAENHSNIYTSKASNQVNVKKYSEVQSITIENDKLVWNAVAGAEEYNIILINKETNEQTKINVRDSNSIENIKYDLASLNISGKYIAKIETISNYSLGLNSKISTVQREFVKLACPTPDKIEDNKLLFKEVEGIDSVPVLVKIGDITLTDADTTFTLPEDSLAGTYNLFFKAIGDGSNVVSSVWSTTAYEVTKLPAPTSVTHDGYKVTVNNVPGSKGIDFSDFYNDFNITSEVESELISKDDDNYKYWISVTDKVNKYSLLNQNRFTIKAKAIGDNAFDSNYSEQSFSFYKLLPMTQVTASAIATGGINFRYGGLNAKQDGSDVIITGFHEEIGIGGVSIVGEILSGESREIVEPLVKVDGDKLYFDVCVKVYRIVGDELEELYMTILSFNSSQLAINELNETIKGGELIFKMSFYGNNVDVLGGEEKLCGVENGDQAFSMRKAYEPINIVVTNNDLEWEVLEGEDTDLFIISDVDNNEIYRGSEPSTDLVRNIISEYGVLHNFTIYNSNENKESTIYWQSSKKVAFSAGILNAPTIAFNGDYIEWTPVANATEYIVCFNDDTEIISINDIEDGKLKFNYKEHLAQKGGEYIVKVIASMGANSEVLWFDSADSNTLTVRNIFVEYIDVKDGLVLAKPNLDFDVTLNVKITNEDGDVVYTGNAVYDATATITENNLVGAYVFDILEQLSSSGYYNLKLQFVYSGEQSAQVKFINFDEITIKNIAYIPQSVALNFNEDANGYPFVTWGNITSATGFTLLVKDVTTNEIVEVVIPNTTTTSYNLSLVEGLKTTSYYVIALIANGDGDQKVLRFETENDKDTIVVEKTQSYILPTIAEYLNVYNNNSQYFYIAGQVQNLDSTINGYEVSLTWTKEDGINYEIYVDGVLTQTQSENLYKYTIDTSNQTQVSFKLKAKSTTNSLMYRSAFSNEITVLLLPAVTNLSANGFVTFDYNIENIQFKVEIVDVNTGLPVSNFTTASKQINFSNLGLDYNHTYNVSVTALGNGKTTIQSITQSVNNLTVASALVLDVDSTNGVFITNNTMPYITFFAQRYEDGSYTDEYSYGIYASVSNPVWNISASVPAGKYKVWASATNTSTGANEIYGIASNYLYIEVLPTPTGICLKNDSITFMPVDGQDTYIIQIIQGNNTTTNTVVIADTTSEYSYSTTLLDNAGEYTIRIQTKGNYNACTTDTFNATANSPVSNDLIVTRLAAPSGAQINNGVLTFNTVEQAEKYRIVFSCVGEDDIVKETIQNSYNLADVEFNVGTYSCTIQAIGNNERNILSSVAVTVSSNIVITTNEDVTLTINSTTQRLEWNAVTASYGYSVKFYNTTTTETMLFNTTDNFFVVPNSVVAGTYNITVYAKGNGSNILDGKESNLLNVVKLPNVQNLRKVQSEAQNNQSKASIDFDLIDGVNVYLIKVVLPDNSIYSEEYDVSVNGAFEYTFNTAGQYVISVVAVGNYIQTISSNPQTITLQKLANPQDLTFAYSTNITEQNQIQILATTSWTSQSNTNVRYKILFNVFGNQTETIDVTEDVSQSRYTATFDISTINKVTNTIKLRFDIALNNQQYLSSDWAEIELYVYNPITITKVQDKTMMFTYHVDDEPKLEYVNSLIVFIKDVSTEAIVKASSVNVITTGEVDISSVLENLPNGDYVIGAYVIGNGATYLASSASTLKSFTKLAAPSVSLSKSIANNNYYSTFITWDTVQDATKYEIRANDTFVAYTTNLFYDLADVIDGFDGASSMLTISVSALGGVNYAQSSNSSLLLSILDTNLMTKSVEQEDGTTKVEQKIYLQDGSFVIEEDLLQNYYVVAKIISGATTVEEIVQTAIYDVSSTITSGANVYAYFRIIPKNFIEATVDAGASGDPETYYVVSSKYLQIRPRNITPEEDKFYRLQNGVTSFSDGRLKVSIPTYQKVNGGNIYLEVLWGSIDHIYALEYAADSICEIQVPATVIPYNEIVVKYRFVGDNYNVSSAYSLFNLTADKFAVVDPISPIAEDGTLSWNAIPNASGYELRIVHDTENKECSEYSALGYVFYTKKLSSATLQCDIEDLIAEIKEHSNYINVLSDNLDYKDERIASGKIFNVLITIYALGDANLSVNSTTFLTSAGKKVYLTQLSTPNLNCVGGQLKVVSGGAEVREDLIEIVVDGVSHIISGDINYLFNQTKTYSNVKLRLYANASLGANLGIAAYYTTSGEWAEGFTIYKIPTISSISLNNEGFLQFSAPFEDYGSTGFATMQGLDAYVKIIIEYGDERELVTEVAMTQNSTTISGSMFLDSYLQGYLDFLPEGISSIKISIVGATYSNENTSTAFIVSSEYTSATALNKLATPKKFAIQNSVLSWDEVENATKYVLIVNNGSSNKTIIVNDTSYSVLRNLEFPAGNYSVEVRAIGDANNLCSSATQKIQFKVYAAPVISIEDGYIYIRSTENATTAYAFGEDNASRTFESTYTFSAAQGLGPREAKCELPADIVNNTILTYTMKFNIVGDGVQFIDSFYVENIIAKRLPQIALDISSYQGKLMWAPVNFENGDMVENYIIKVVDSSQQVREFPIAVNNSNFNGTYYLADIPPSMDLYGLVRVSVKPQGSHHIDDDYINGPYSSALQAYKYNPSITINVSDASGSIGCLSWSTNEGSTIAGFRFVLYTDVANYTYVEHSEEITNYYYDIPATIPNTEPSPEYYSLTGTKSVGVKLVGQFYNNVHYLSTFSKIIEVNRLDKPANFCVNNGILRWNKVDNAKYYELVFNYENPETMQSSEVAKIIIAESASSLQYREYAMTDSALIKGNYSSITVRALGGTKVVNKQTIYYINSSPQTLQNIYKLDKPVISGITLDEVENNGIFINFKPITYVEDSTIKVIKDYRILLKKGGFNSTVDFTAQDITPETEAISKKFVTSTLTDGVYELYIMALAPNSDNVVENHIINSVYSDKIYVTKPGNITNLRFENMCYTWTAPSGIASSEISYDIHYIVQNELGIYGSVQKKTLTDTKFYPPKLGTYKIVVVASVQGCLKSDYVGQISYLSPQNRCNTLEEFINTWGVEGSNLGLFAGGEGTLIKPYEITNATNFANMKYYSNTGFYFKLVDNLGSSNTGISFDTLVGLSTDTQLASASNPFKANFNGNNKTIYITELLDTNTAYNGLFGYVDGGQISNLNVVVNNVTYDIACRSDLKVGALVGFASNAILSNVKVTANIELQYGSSASSTSIYAGGIVGFAEKNTIIEQCKFNGSIGFGDINSVVVNIPNVTSYVGGIVGNFDSVTSSESIRSCVNLGTIQGTIVGGIAGKTNASIIKCINMGTLEAIESQISAPLVGGLVGSITLTNMSMKISKSYNKGDINIYIINKENSSIGGLVGRMNYAPNTSAYNVTIEDTFTTGIITIENTYNRSASIGALLGHPNSVAVIFTRTYYLYTSTQTANTYPIAANTSTITRTNNYDFKDSLTNAVNNINGKFAQNVFTRSGSTIILNDVSESM